MVSEYVQRQLMHDCFNGNVDRKCSTCPAHHGRGGICCFGDINEYNEDDDNCKECVYQNDCQEDVIEEEAERQYASRVASPQSSSTVWRKSQPVFRRPGSRFAAPAPSNSSSSRLVQIGSQKKESEGIRPSVITPPSRETQEVDSQVDTMFKRFIKDSAWGAFQGFFEMAAHFFRSHRLP